MIGFFRQFSEGFQGSFRRDLKAVWVDFFGGPERNFSAGSGGILKAIWVDFSATLSGFFQQYSEGFEVSLNGFFSANYFQVFPGISNLSDLSDPSDFSDFPGISDLSDLSDLPDLSDQVFQVFPGISFRLCLNLKSSQQPQLLWSTNTLKTMWDYTRHPRYQYIFQQTVSW